MKETIPGENIAIFVICGFIIGGLIFGIFFVPKQHSDPLVKLNDINPVLLSSSTNLFNRTFYKTIPIASAEDIISEKLKGRQFKVIDGITFVEYGGLTPILNFCPVCGTYCLSVYCGSCGAKQSKYLYIEYCSICNIECSGSTKYCTSCGTKIVYKKIKRD